jgi:hypothetical protein
MTTPNIETGTPEERQRKLLDYSSDLLAKLINEEYENILVAERTNLPRARAIGEKLTVLRMRTTHGEWQSQLQRWCPQISYETATKYIRVYRHWSNIEREAARKGVATTTLTIDGALKLVAKPKSQKTADTTQADDDSSDANTGDADTSDGEDDDGSEDAADGEGDDGWLPEVRLKAFTPADLVALLQRIHDTEYLTALAAELVKVLRSTPSATATSASEVSVRRM